MLTLLLSACAPESGDKTTAGPASEVADDRDGYSEEEGDCAPEDENVHPGATEVCNGIDDNCDGAVDEGVQTTVYPDDDGDGSGDAARPRDVCEAGAGEVPNGNDCDDTRADVFPGAPETCNEVDDNCDGAVDEGVTNTWYADADGDGFGAADAPTEACVEEPGLTTDDTDCNDSNALVNPGADETCNELDDDCDLQVDEEVTRTFYGDLDGDGFGVGDLTQEACALPTGFSDTADDCDDDDAGVHPYAPELCDGLDQDCDTVPDDGIDADGDGTADCFDAEACDGLDNDGDGSVDESDAVDAPTWYVDYDGDGYGSPRITAVACAAPASYVASSDDCDDTDDSLNPGATELCDGVDQDCDGTADDGLDADADGLADCDDEEECDGVDNDGDGSVDEADALDVSEWYADADGDGHGDADDVETACDAPAGYVADDADCDDADAAIHPSAVEDCDSVDNDCDGSVDEDGTLGTWYDDDDGDGYGGAAVSGCSQPPDTVVNDWDCDDTSSAIYPGADASCPWSSCLDLLTDGIASSSGSYWIDFDGTSTSTSCDMTTDGGGWTLIFDDNFDSGSDPGWSISGRYSCGGWGYMLGGYGIMAGGDITNPVDAYAIAHTSVWVQLNYRKLDSWDGETGYVKVDGTTIWSLAMNDHGGSGSEVCGWNRGSAGSYDSTQAVSAVASSSGDPIALVAGSTLDQGADDESFGIDDVWVWVR